MATEVVEEARHSVSSLASVRHLIDEVVHLSWYALTADPKDGTPPGSLKIHRPWLEWIVGIVHLTGKIVRVMYTSRPAYRWDG